VDYAKTVKIGFSVYNMDNKALAETYVELYIYVGDHYEKKTSVQPITEATNMIFEQTCKRIISDRIGEQRGGVPSQQKAKPKCDQQCDSCGKDLTFGEIKYIKDTDGEHICYKCSH